MHRSASMTDAEAEGDELRLFADNDEDLYRQHKLPILKNLALKKEKGKYDSELAVKLFGYLADAAAKKYVKEAGGTWNLIFTPAARREASRGWRDEFEAEYKYSASDWLGREPREPGAAARKRAPARATSRAVPKAPARARKASRRAR